MRKGIILIFICICISGCLHTQKNINSISGFNGLPFPSNIYFPGQILEVYASPQKVEVMFDGINFSHARVSKGLNISTTEIQKLEGRFAAEITKVAKAAMGGESFSSVKVNLTDTRLAAIDKVKLFSEFKKILQENHEVKELLKEYERVGRRATIATATLKANITFSLLNASGSELTIDSEVIDKLNGQFDLGFKKGKGNMVVKTGKDLVVGFHDDDELLNIVLNSLEK